MGKAADWLREERRNVLGHWSAFCLDCGRPHGRWFVDNEEEIPETCVRAAAGCCAAAPPARPRSRRTFAIDCEECGHAAP